jgi:hypothetical protein
MCCGCPCNVFSSVFVRMQSFPGSASQQHRIHWWQSGYIKHGHLSTREAWTATSLGALHLSGTGTLPRASCEEHFACAMMSFPAELVCRCDPSTHWTVPRQMITWWKNFIERRRCVHLRCYQGSKYYPFTSVPSKYEAMINEASYEGDDMNLLKRAQFCRAILQLVGMIKHTQTNVCSSCDMRVSRPCAKSHLMLTSLILFPDA